MTSSDSDGKASDHSTKCQHQMVGTVKLPKMVPFKDLCRCGDEVWIENEGQIYRLRRTKLGKLILTK